MPREVKEWLGSSSDSDPPPRVKVRVFDKYHGVCCCGCNRKILAGEKWQVDHIIALINGGENKESNLQPLLVEHHRDKTKEDVAEKSEVYSKRKLHLGIKKKSRFSCSKDSKWKKKITGEVVRR